MTTPVRLNSLKAPGDVLKRGRRRRFSVLSARVLPSDELGLAVVVSKRSFGNAVKRNRVRRRVREAVRVTGLPVAAWAIIPAPAAATAAFSDLCQAVEGLKHA